MRVFKSISELVSIKNPVVSIGTLGIIENHTVDTVFNQTAQLPAQTGILDTRFDDVRYYTGDTAS